MVRTSKSRRKPISVGDRVRFAFGADTIEADVLEDRGNIGYKGRRLLRIRPLFSYGAGEDFEIPAEDIIEVIRAREK